jgi:hypothetical protein
VKTKKKEDELRVKNSLKTIKDTEKGLRTLDTSAIAENCLSEKIFRKSRSDKKK